MYRYGATVAFPPVPDFDQILIDIIKNIIQFLFFYKQMVNTSAYKWILLSTYHAM